MKKPRIIRAVEVAADKAPQDNKQQLLAAIDWMMNNAAKDYNCVVKAHFLCVMTDLRKKLKKYSPEGK